MLLDGAEMRKGRAGGYIVSHFVGHQGFAWSFFVNGLAFYFLLIGFLFAADLYLPPQIEGDISDLSVVSLLCGLTWSIVGNVASALTILRSRNSHFLIKLLAVIAVPTVLLVAAYLTAGVFWWWAWNYY